MAFADEAKLSGREPMVLVELALDFCPKLNGSATHEDTIAGFNANLLAYSGALDNAAWSKILASVQANTDLDPDGLLTADRIVEDTSNGVHSVSQGSLSVDGSSVYTYQVRLKAGSRTKGRISLSASGFQNVPYGEFDLSLGTVIASADVDAVAIASLGSGWYSCSIKATSDAAVSDAACSISLLDALGTLSYLGDGTSYLICGGSMLEKNSVVTDYQATGPLDGSETNITLTTGGLTLDALIGEDAVIGDVEGSLSDYPIVDNGVGWLRVTGDASGEGTGVAIITAADGDTACRADVAAGAECYNTRATCQSFIDYLAGKKTYRFATPREGIPAKENIFPSVTGVSFTPTKIGLRLGLAASGAAQITFRDHPHHDRGIDPYVATRTYDPDEQGTFWGKLLARNPFTQGRTMRVRVGYIGDTFDADDDFESQTFAIEQISGPDSAGRVRVVGKDILRQAFSDRASAPRASKGSLSADLTDAATSATLSPAGVGDADYAASGTVRIGNEVMTFTRAGDVLTLVRGQDGTVAEAHGAGDVVQECIRWTDTTVDLIIEDLLVNYAGIDASYIDSAAWAEEVENALGGHLASALVTEPTPVQGLLKELTDAYMLFLWWDAKAEEIRLEVVFPFFEAPPELTDRQHFVADSVQVTEKPRDRRSQLWIHYEVRDPTASATDVANYRKLFIQLDQGAESPVEYGDSRIETMTARFFTDDIDAIRTGGRLIARLRDNPREFAFTLDAKDSGIELGDVVTLKTVCLQGPDGAPLATPVRIVEKAETDGHSIRFRAIDEAFDGRYARWVADSSPDYDAATEEDRRKGFWIAEDLPDPDDALNGDGAYKVA